MNNYKYQLDTSSKKFECPNCHKKRFVRYIETETSNYLDSVYGRCDREQECRYHLKPDQKAHNISYTPIVKKAPDYIERDHLERSLRHYEINPFVLWLKTQFSKEEVDTLIDRYHIGTSKAFGGAVVYWQVDDKNRVRSGKIMGYDSTTGRRYKDQFDWAHSRLKLTDFELDQCLFGLHLVQDESAEIAIVESEKTAIVMSGLLPKYTWLATGGSGNFKPQMLSPLKNNRITAFPDEGCYDKWSNIGSELKHQGFNIRVSRILETAGVRGTGYDILDVLRH